MLRAEGDRLARQFVGDLGDVLTKCAKDAAELKRTFHKGPLGNGSEAVAFSSTLPAEMDNLNGHFPRLQTYAKEAPLADSMLAAAFAQLKIVTEIFDRFESKIESAYGIPPVVVPVKKEASSSIVPSDVPSTSIFGVGEAVSLEISTGVPLAKLGRSPQKPQGPKVELPMPKTPGLEDFGISNEDLRGLGMTGSPHGTEGKALQSSAFAYDTLASASRSHTGQTHGAAFDNRDAAELAQTSISELGIETPREVADKYESRRHRALAKMMVTSTPRLKSGGVERTMNYTGLAGGYYAPSASKAESTVDTHRQLNFDETPRGGGVGGAKAQELRKRIADGFADLGFWSSKVTCGSLQEAAAVLAKQEDRLFDKHELTDILSDNMPGISSFSIIASLNKLGILELDKRQGEEARYHLA